MLDIMFSQEKRKAFCFRFLDHLKLEGIWKLVLLSLVLNSETFANSYPMAFAVMVRRFVVIGESLLILRRLFRYLRSSAVAGKPPIRVLVTGAAGMWKFQPYLFILIEHPWRVGFFLIIKITETNGCIP